MLFRLVPTFGRILQTWWKHLIVTSKTFGLFLKMRPLRRSLTLIKGSSPGTMKDQRSSSESTPEPKLKEISFGPQNRLFHVLAWWILPLIYLDTLLICLRSEYAQKGLNTSWSHSSGQMDTSEILKQPTQIQKISCLKIFELINWKRSTKG